jgi:tetratricopeptide (TPR) repeat protein
MGVGRPKRWDSPFVLGLDLCVLLLVLGAVVATAFAHIDDPRESLCKQGAELRNGRLLERSEQVYAGAAQEGRACGGEGQREVSREQDEATKRFSSAAIRTASEQPEQKRKAAELYIKGLSLNPFEPAARGALSELLKEPAVLLAAKPGEKPAEGELCRLAMRLIDARLLAGAGPVIASEEKEGRSCDGELRELTEQTALADARLREAQALGAEPDRGAARAEYARALRANPELVEARGGLENGVEEGSNIEAIGRRLGDVPDTAKDALVWLVPLAIGLMLVVLLVRMGMTQLAKRWQSWRLWLIALGEALRFPLVRNAARPRLTIGSFAGDEAAKGGDFAALFEAALPQPDTRKPAFPFDRIDKGSPTDDAGGGATQLLEAFAETKLLGSIVKIVETLYRRRTIEIKGQLASVSDRGAGVTVTLEGIDSPAQSSVALWERDFDPLPGGEGVQRWQRLLPAATAWTRWQLATAYAPDARSRDPEGWLPDALFRAGVVWHRSRDLVRASALYAAALERDPDLLPAAYNLSVTEIRSGCYPEARERLLNLRARLDDDSAATWKDLDGASLYALTLSDAYAAGSDADAPELDRALTSATALVGKLLAEPNEVEGTESPSIVLLARLTAQSDANLAMEASKQASTKQAPSQPRDDEAQEKARQVLKTELAKPKSDETKPWDLIEYVRANSEVSMRTRYNLACYYATLGRLVAGYRPVTFELALRQLDLALESGGLTEWARKDPSLAALRAEWPEQFEKIVGRHTLSPHDAEEEEDQPDEGATEGDAPAPVVETSAPAPAPAKEVDAVPLLTELANEVGGLTTVNGGGDGFTYAVHGKEADVLVLRSEDPSWAECDALVKAAQSWDRARPRLVLAVPADHVRQRQQITHRGMTIALRPLPVEE